MATTVGLLHPGEMGAVVGACLRAGGVRVVWASAGRSDATRRRAAAAGLEDLGALAAVVDGQRRDVLRVPPGGRDGRRPAGRGRAVRGTLRGRERRRARDRRAPSGRSSARPEPSFVDGGIIGPPPREAGTTRLYLAGPRAGEVASLFKGARSRPS